MAGEGGGIGALPIVGTIAKIVTDVQARRRAERREEREQRWQAAVAMSRVGSTPVPRPDVSPAARPLPVLRALPGTPGSPVPPPAPSGGGPAFPGQGFLLFTLTILDLLRRFGVRLPWEPKPPRLGAPEFNIFTGGDPMAYFVAPSGPVDPFASLYGGGGGWGAGLAGLGQGIGSIIQAIRGPSSMPGGMSFLPTTIARGMGSLATGAGLGYGISQLFGGGACPTDPFAAGVSSRRATTFVMAHPDTGRAVWFKPAGRPILWSGDLTACRRVRKIAGRAKRRLGGR